MNTFLNKPRNDPFEITERRISNFHKKIDRPKNPSNCWIWVGAKDKDGYGQFRAGYRMAKAHRFSYSLFHGPIPDDALICHSCDNPSCVNPMHIAPGTWATNINDMMERGRCNPPQGEKYNFNKLTTEKIKEIRRLRISGLLHRELADKFNVSTSLIHLVLARKRWAHIK